MLHGNPIGKDAKIEDGQACWVGGNMDGNDGEFSTTFEPADQRRCRT